jgi:hypothetical protein
VTVLKLHHTRPHHQTVLNIQKTENVICHFALKNIFSECAYQNLSKKNCNKINMETQKDDTFLRITTLKAQTAQVEG